MCGGGGEGALTAVQRIINSLYHSILFLRPRGNRKALIVCFYSMGKKGKKRDREIPLATLLGVFHRTSSLENATAALQT